MKELFENEDEILGLVRKRGLIKPAADFTSRVMQSIEEAREPVIYQPLLSKKVWIFLIGGFLLAIILCWYVLSGSPSGSFFDLSGSLNLIGDLVSRIDFSFKFDSNALLIITLAIVSMGVLLSIDMWFSNNRKGNAV
jgi:hypothetical protein